MRILATRGYSDQRPNVRYGAMGESLLVCFHPWVIYRWDLAGGDNELYPCVTQEDGWHPWRRLLACAFVPGGEAFLRARTFWPGGEDLPPRVDDARRLARLSMFEEETDFVPRAFHPDGRGFLHWPKGGFSALADPRLTLWGMDGTPRTYYDLVAFPYAAGRWAYSPDGAVLAAQGWSPAITLMPGAGGAPFADLLHTVEVSRFAWAPAGHLLASAAGRTVRLWDAGTQECLHQFRAFRRDVESLAFSADRRLLAAGARDGRVQVWDVASGRRLADLDWGQGEVYGLAFSPDGQTAAAACFKAVVVWDVDV